MVRPRYLLDTNMLSEPLKPQPHPRVIEKLHRHRYELATATVVWHELAGCWSRRIDNEHRLVHAVTDEKISILACRYHY